ncbi:MAG: PGPGW domain-containing protein [Halofilum sp. (in: g-proteobacteria)]
MTDDRHGRDRPEVSQSRASSPWQIDWWVRQGLRQVWRLIILIVGGTVLLLGVVMIITPGPALVVIPIGLAILAVEFAWARTLLNRVRARATELRDQYWSGRND